MVTTFEWAEGRLKPLGSSESLTAASLTLPAGAYTTLRTYGADRLLRLPQHAQRLRESVVPPSERTDLEESQLRRALGAALGACSHPESRLRVTWAPPRLFVSVEPFEPLPPALYREGVACRTLPGHRENPHAKDTRFIATAADTYRRLAPGIHEGLLVDGDGAILEGLSSNFFAISRGELRTEEARVLLGVTRSIVLDLARALLPVSTVPVTTGDLDAVGEAFITSASRGVLPVAHVDGRALGDGRPGPVTRELMARLAALVELEAETV